jgi:phage-related minor tail protein
VSRPRKEITAEHLEQVQILAGYGLTEAQIAHVIGVSPATFRRRKEDEEQVLSALEKGQAVAQSVIAQALYNKAKAGDLGAIVWWEKTRAGRHETTTTRIEGAMPTTTADRARQELEQNIDRIAKHRRGQLKVVPKSA